MLTEIHREEKKTARESKTLFCDSGFCYRHDMKLNETDLVRG
jgi:hypothetical protein